MTAPDGIRREWLQRMADGEIATSSGAMCDPVTGEINLRQPIFCSYLREFREAGWIERKNRMWVITDQGRNALAKSLLSEMAGDPSVSSEDS